jgi:hypothetical protein
MSPSVSVPTVAQILAELSANQGRVLSPGAGEKSVTGVQIGDLLSFIIGGSREGDAWITIQVHLNVAAVAVLKEIPLVILAANREPSKELTAKCIEEDIALLAVPYSVYATALRLCRLGVPER